MGYLVALYFVGLAISIGVYAGVTEAASGDDWAGAMMFGLVWPVAVREVLSCG